MMGMTMDFSETVIKWKPPKLKEWETVGEAKIIIMSWYRMWFEIMPAEKGTIAKLSITYLRQNNGIIKSFPLFLPNGIVIGA